MQLLMFPEYGPPAPPEEATLLPSAKLRIELTVYEDGHGYLAHSWDPSPSSRIHGCDRVNVSSPMQWSDHLNALVDAYLPSYIEPF